MALEIGTEADSAPDVRAGELRPGAQTGSLRGLSYHLATRRMNLGVFLTCTESAREPKDGVHVTLKTSYGKSWRKPNGKGPETGYSSPVSDEVR